MATAKRLPSGSWRVLVFSHRDSNGKRHYESFTAPTKREAEMKAAEWAGRKERRGKSDLTVREAIEGYIRAKEGVLSPSTIRGYDRMLRNNYGPIGEKPIRRLTTEDLQLFVSALAKAHSPKSVRNIYGLLSSSLSLYMPDTVFRVTLPKKANKRQTSPSDEDIQELFRAASTELKKCIALSAFGSLRRGEICALTYADLNGNIVSVTKDIVQDRDGKWVLKEIPKTDDGVRDAGLPDKVVNLLGSGEPDENIVKYSTPGNITQCFSKLRDRLGINVRFHDLRHYFASIGAVLGIPDSYLSDFGGWKRGSTVMKEVYQNSIASKSKEYQDRMKKHFDGLI